MLQESVTSNKRKVCVVITSRASYARIKSVLHAIMEHPDLELQLVTGASTLLEKYGSAVNTIEKDGFPISARLHMIIEGENPIAMARSTGLGLLDLSTTFESLRPDIVLTVADRFETIATAVAASYMNIPLAHVQGGEVTGSIDNRVRNAVTKLANLHFVSNEKCAERLIRMGEHPDTVFVTGCPSVDLAAQVLHHPELDYEPFVKYTGTGSVFDLSSSYIVAIQHSVTTEYESALSQIEQTLHAVYELGIPTLWFWPNVDAGSDKISKGIRIFREKHMDSPIHFFKNLPPEDFLKLLCNAICIVGNSSVAVRECSFLGVPAVNIGTRQKGRERGANVIDVPHDKQLIKEAILRQLNNSKYPTEHLYGDGLSGPRVAKLLASAKLDIHKEHVY